jgi:mannose-6-phosphate isomerase-like protein (cupin superfamily)
MIEPVSRALPEAVDELAPDGSEVRHLCRTPGGSLAHFRFPAGAVSRAVRHRSVEELWYVVSGRGEIWCEPASGSARILPLFPGTSLAIPARCAFQVRVDDEAPLEVVGVTLPPWPGDGEAELVAGRWITDMPAAGPE